MENIKNRWELDNNNWNEDFYTVYTIQEVEEDGETFFDVLNPDGDQMEYFDSYENAIKYINGLWEDEKFDHEEEEEYEHATNVPDSVESLWLGGMF